jgi:hypothetical protein
MHWKTAVPISCANFITLLGLLKYAHRRCTQFVNKLYRKEYMRFTHLSAEHLHGLYRTLGRHLKERSWRIVNKLLFSSNFATFHHLIVKIFVFYFKFFRKIVPSLAQCISKRKCNGGHNFYLMGYRSLQFIFLVWQIYITRGKLW